MMKHLLLVVAVAVGGCGKPQSPPTRLPPPIPSGPASQAVVVNETLVRDLAILTTQAEPTAALKLLGANNDVEGMIAMLLADKRFTNTVVPTMLLEDYRFTSHLSIKSSFVLKQTSDDPKQPIFYLRKPCKRVGATNVEPWWAPGTQVLICSDDYKPDALYRHKLPGRPNDVAPVCGSSSSDIQPECGCGRNLIHCTRDRAMRAAIRTSLGAEVFDTIGHVVSSGAPLQSIYRDNATVRDRNAEMMYRMHDIAHGKGTIAALDGFAGPEWKPRADAFPGQHAGILTSTNIARFTDVPRAEMMSYFAMMTCASSDGAHVNGRQALGINTNDIRSESGGKDYLAGAVGCTNCHARMEHAIPFFAGWRSIFHSGEIEPELHKITEGKIYLNNIDDLRGTTKTTPAAFAEVVTAQPEFANCQANRILKYVFNEPVDPGLQDRLVRMIAANKPAREVLKMALVAYVQVMSNRAAAARPAANVAPTDAPAPFQDDAVRTFDKHLVEALAVCEDCHSAGDTWIDQAVQSHQTTALRLLRMADMVASNAMPKKVEIPIADRERIVTQLCQAAWADPKAGSETAEVLLGHHRPAAVHEFGSVIGLFDVLAPHTGSDPPQPWKVPELMMKPGNNFLTPGTAAIYGFEALRSCRARVKPAEVEACVDAVLDDGAFLRTPR